MGGLIFGGTSVIHFIEMEGRENKMFLELSKFGCLVYEDTEMPITKDWKFRISAT